MFGSNKTKEVSEAEELKDDTLDTLTQIDSDKPAKNELVRIKKEELKESDGSAFTMTEKMWGDLYKYVIDDSITDIDYNGRDVWLTNTDNKKWKAPKDEVLNVDKDFAKRLAHRISNSGSKELNQANPVVEVNTDELRISVVHDSVSQGGISTCVRKTQPFVRIEERNAIETGYITRPMLEFLGNCIKAHLNIVVCGEPRAGKTEFCKFLSRYIPDSERVITIEDVLEWRYRKLKPNSDCIEMKCNNRFSYTDAIKASLKQNPRWIMIAETRSTEVKYLIQSFSTGVHGMTTLHTDDISKIPQRMVNMVDDSTAESRFLGNIYEFVDVGVLVNFHYDKDGKPYRCVDQIGFFDYENGEKKFFPFAENGRLLGEDLPKKIKQRMKDARIKNIFENDMVNMALGRQGYEYTSEKLDENKNPVEPVKIENSVA